MFLVLLRGNQAGAGNPRPPPDSCNLIPVSPRPPVQPTSKPESCASDFWAFPADHKNELALLATRGPENPKLEMLEQILQNQFGSPGSPRGIIFTRTRQSAHSLLLWLKQQPGLRTVDIRAQLLIGAGNSSQTTHMTQVGALGKAPEAGEFPRGEEKGSLQHREPGVGGGAEKGDEH